MIDVDRLARALHLSSPETHFRHKCRDRHDIRAAQIIVAYESLAEAPSSRWTHVSPTDHEPDPHYQITGRPAYWICHVKECRKPLLLDGRKPPVALGSHNETPTAEPAMSSQP